MKARNENELGWLLSLLLHQGAKHLRAYEIECCSRFIGALPESLAAIVERQSKEFAYVQHHGDRVSYFSFHGRENVPHVPNRSEVTAARIRLKASAGETINCSVKFANGRLNMLVFSKSTKLLKRGYRWLRTDLLADLTAAREGGPLTIYGRLVKSLSEKYEVRNVLAPEAEERISDHLAAVDAPVPADLESLLKETNGFRIGSYQFVGINSRDLPAPEAMLHIYFEDDRSSNALCLREDEKSPTIWRYDEINQEFENYGPSFIAGIEKLLDNEDKGD